MEIHDSTLLGTVGFDAGFLEPGNALGVDCPVWFHGARFYNFGVGVDTTSGAAASDLTPGTLASFTRDGLTVLLQPKLKAGATDDRLTLGAENLQEFLGTQDGTSAGAPTLTPSGLGAGSAFSVTANG